MSDKARSLNAAIVTRIGILLAVGSAPSSAIGAPASTVCLVSDGRARAVLILPSTPRADEELAAREVQSHVAKMSGAELAIVRGVAKQNRAAAKQMIPVRIGLGVAPETEAVIRGRGDDPAAFAVSVKHDGVSLAGLSPEGTLFAAYELLEQLGVRWYLPGDLGTVVPETKTVELRIGCTLRAPSFAHRHLQTVSRSLPWYRRQKLGGLYFPSSHGIGLLPGADFEKEPELFSLVDGKRANRQLCISHPEVLKRAIARAVDHFAKDPNRPWVGMGPNDNSDYCECENCLELDSGEWEPFSAKPSMTDRYVWFFNRVLEGVHQKYPGKKICFYAYDACKWPPRKCKPDPHIVPAFAPITLCRIHGMGNPICPDRSLYKTLMAEWGKLLPELFERGYYFNLACPGFPFSKIHAVRVETPIAHKLGIKGWRVECMPGWASHGPTLYIAARLMWDHTADVDAILAEFYEKFFGPAAKPMGAYLESIDRAYRETDCHSGSSFAMPRVFGGGWMGRGDALLKAAERKAKGGIFAERVRIFRLNYRHLAAFLDMLTARNRFDFGQAYAHLGRLREISQTMIDYRLYPSRPRIAPIDPARDKRYRHEARLLWPRAGRSYLNRFWSPCVESGHERVVARGELAAGAPDTWDFLIDTTGVGETLRWYRDGPIGGNWQKMRTYTATWSDQGLHYYKGLAWYRTRVALPARFKGRKVYLWFGGVDEWARVWLNGTLLGTSDAPGDGLPPASGTFKPFEFNATQAVRFGEVNTIAVMILNRKLSEIGTGGITAPVMFWSPKDR